MRVFIGNIFWYIDFEPFVHLVIYDIFSTGGKKKLLWSLLLMLRPIRFLEHLCVGLMHLKLFRYYYYFTFSAIYDASAIYVANCLGAYIFSFHNCYLLLWGPYCDSEYRSQNEHMSGPKIREVRTESKGESCEK